MFWFLFEFTTSQYLFLTSSRLMPNSSSINLATFGVSILQFLLYAGLICLISNSRVLRNFVNVLGFIPIAVESCCFVITSAGEKDKIKMFFTGSFMFNPPALKLFQGPPVRFPLVAHVESFLILLH